MSRWEIQALPRRMLDEMASKISSILESLGILPQERREEKAGAWESGRAV